MSAAPPLAPRAAAPAPPTVPSLTHLAWSRSLPASQWASLVDQLAQKEALAPAVVEQAVLAALVPPLTAYHLSLLAAALSSTPTPLATPQALLLAALSPSLSPSPPASLWPLLLPYAPLLTLPPSSASRLLDLLSANRTPALADLGARLIAHSGLPPPVSAQASTLLATLRASPAGQQTANLQLALQRAASQLLLATGAGGGPIGAEAVKGGLEERVLGALETDVQSMMKDPSVGAGAGGEGATELGAGKKLAGIVLEALASHAPLDRQMLLQSTTDAFGHALKGGKDELVLKLFKAGLERLAADGKASRTLLVGQLPSLVPALALVDPAALVQSLFAAPEIGPLLARIDQAALSASARVQSASRMEGVEDELEQGMHDGEEQHEDRPAGSSLPPIKLDLLEAFVVAGVLGPDQAHALGLPAGAGAVRPSALAEGEMLGFGDLASYWTHVCSGATSATDRQAALALDRVRSLDFDSQHSLSEVFFETWRSACAEKNVSLLASLSETLLATETRGLLAALLEWGAGLQAVLEFARLGVHFLETFDGEGYGDSQSTLLQYAQISACLQLLLRQQSLERTNLGSVDGRSISAAFFGQASTAYLLAALSEDEKDLLSGWITALFGSEGIADDLLQATPPRSLLKLATTLVAQALTAFQRKMVDFDTLKAGLSWLPGQPFLAWQLTGVVRWLASEIRRVRSRGGAHLMVLESLLLDPGCPPVVVELHGQAVLDLLDEPATKSMPGGAIDADAIRQRIAATLGSSSRSSASTAAQPFGRSWSATLDAFAEHHLSPSASPAPPLPPSATLSTLVRHLGPSAVLASLWVALVAPLATSSGAIDRFAALVALFPTGGLLETFIVQLVPQAQVNLPDARLPMLDAVVRRVVELASAVPGAQTQVGPLLRALESELAGARFSARKGGVRGERRSVLRAVDQVVGVAAPA